MQSRAPLDHAPRLLTKSDWVWFDDHANPLDIASNRRPTLGRTCDRRALRLLAVQCRERVDWHLPQPSVCEGAPMPMYPFLPIPGPSALLVRRRRSLRPLAPPSGSRSRMWPLAVFLARKANIKEATRWWLPSVGDFSPRQGPRPLPASGPLHKRIKPHIDTKYQVLNLHPHKKETDMAKNWREMTVLKLLRTHAKAMEELVRRDIAIAADNPVGGYAEVLVCQGLGLERMPRNHPGFDGLDHNTRKQYQIKGRRKSKSRVHSGPLRHLEERRFDYLVMVVFNADFTVHRADKIPHDVVLELAKYQKGNRYHIFWMTDAVRADSRVENITDLLPKRID